MKNTTVIFLVLFLFPICLFADESSLSRFYREYSEVNHSLMSDKGCLDELIELQSLDAKAADKIAHFWAFKSEMECYDFIEKIMHSSKSPGLYKEIDYNYYMDTRITKVFGGKYEDLNKAQEDAERCHYCIYHENWDAINKMILDKLKTVKEAANEKVQDKW
ncbi:hypothetical protein SCALIN_C22_0084 [Candidatus Scalindua japonica]|uniref:Uncharacterized protein n=1 Tax=Candidatus Scalindua japonica TaxID=1284222 RepID=A0A286TZT2_9BACT|nr:hypothetical protein [Candidatus Scalindua japonica]GAX61374.1 hypothetical protein SCALIN_C22_0084 [Candidatus Scalindua japonica]